MLEILWDRGIISSLSWWFEIKIFILPLRLQKGVKLCFKPVFYPNRSRTCTPTIILFRLQLNYQPISLGLSFYLLALENSMDDKLAKCFGERDKILPITTLSLKLKAIYHKLQITRLKIDSNPFAKGFRDSIRILPVQRYVCRAEAC